MKNSSKKITIEKFLYLCLYYGFARYLPKSHTLIWGYVVTLSVKSYSKRCGKQVNIERMAYFASGTEIEIGIYSGIGFNAYIPNGTIIGDYVMMGPNCFILDVNHKISDTTKPMCFQAIRGKNTVIGNDVWIGRDVHMTPGRIIAEGTIVAMSAVLTKDSPLFSCRWKFCKAY